jgi:integrase
MDDFVNSIIGRPRTIKAYTSIFRNHVEPYLSPEEAKNIDQRDLDILTQTWISKKLSSSTVNTVLLVLRQYIRWAGAAENQINTKGLAKRISRLQQEREYSCLTRGEAEAILKEAKKQGGKVYLYCLLGFHTGLRRGEIMGLKWSDFDPVKNRIHVQRTYRDEPTKSGKSRMVPISEDLENALQEEEYLTRKTDDFVFEKIIHHPNVILAVLCERAGVPIITSHGMRHTFATLALESGMSPKTVQTWLGHANLATTLNTYWKVLPHESRLEFLPSIKD